MDAFFCDPQDRSLCMVTWLLPVVMCKSKFPNIIDHTVYRTRGSKLILQRWRKIMIIPCESIKSWHFDNGPLFSCRTEYNIEFDIYWKNNFSCFFWYNICWGNFYGWLPKPQIRKLCQNTFVPNLGLDRYRAHYTWSTQVCHCEHAGTYPTFLECVLFAYSRRENNLWNPVWYIILLQNEVWGF